MIISFRTEKHFFTIQLLLLQQLITHNFWMLDFYWKPNFKMLFIFFGLSLSINPNWKILQDQSWKTLMTRTQIFTLIRSWNSISNSNSSWTRIFVIHLNEMLLLFMKFCDWSIYMQFVLALLLICSMNLLIQINLSLHQSKNSSKYWYKIDVWRYNPSYL